MARERRTQLEVEELRKAIFRKVKDERPMTVRQLFYRLVSDGVIPKTENAYKNTLGRLLVEMRLSGRLPFRWITDNTRAMRKPWSHDSLSDMLGDCVDLYRRNLWREQESYVEIWLEKDALSGVLYQVTREWDVPLMVTRGYPSLTFLHEAAMAIRAQGKPAFLFYLGDHDPSGIDIPRTTEERIREFAPGADITFERIAVTREQIAKYNLPTRPTKRTDSRAKGFEGESVEVDAIPPTELKRLVRSCIEQHIDQDRLDRLRTVEAAERETLKDFALSMKG